MSSRDQREVLVSDERGINIIEPVPPQPRGLPIGRFVAVTDFLTFLERHDVLLAFPEQSPYYHTCIDPAKDYMAILAAYLEDWQTVRRDRDVKTE